MKFKLSRRWIALPVLAGMASVAAACGAPDAEPIPDEGLPPIEEPGEPGAPGDAPGEDPPAE